MENIDKKIDVCALGSKILTARVMEQENAVGLYVSDTSRNPNHPNLEELVCVLDAKDAYHFTSDISIATVYSQYVNRSNAERIASFDQTIQRGEATPEDNETELSF